MPTTGINQGKNQGAHYRNKSGKTSGCPLQEKIRENREFCEETSLQGKIPCKGIRGKFVKSGKNQGILQKHVREISGNFEPVSEYKKSQKLCI